MHTVSVQWEGGAEQKRDSPSCVLRLHPGNTRCGGVVKEGKHPSAKPWPQPPRGLPSRLPAFSRFHKPMTSELQKLTWALRLQPTLQVGIAGLEGPASFGPKLPFTSHCPSLSSPVKPSEQLGSQSTWKEQQPATWG